MVYLNDDGPCLTPTAHHRARNTALRRLRSPWPIAVLLILVLLLCLYVPAYAASGWNPQTTPEWNLFGVSAASTTHVWAVGDNGLIAHTTDSGANWSAQGSGTSEHLYDISSTDTSNAWAVGGHVEIGPEPPETMTTVGVITNTTDGGSNWSSMTTNSELHGISATSPSNAWAVGFSISGSVSSPVLLHTTDGINWNPEDPGSVGNLRGVDAVDGDNAWAVGDSGTIIHTSNGGANWQGQTSGTGERLRGVAAVSSSEAWVVGANGVILHTTDGGSHWGPQTSNVTKELFRIAAASPRDLWAVGYQDTSVHTTDGGASWTPYLGSIEYFNSVSAVETGDAWGVGATFSGVPDIVRWSQGLHITNLSDYAATCGDTITISGTDFGADPGTHTSDYVRFGAFAPDETDYVSWNNNYIQVKVPGDAYGTTNVYVHTGGLDSNSLPLTVIPAISAPLSPSEGWPGSPVTITGTGFGPTQGDASGHVFFGATGASVTAWSDTSITATVPVISMGATTVRVNAYGNDSNAEGFTVTGFTLTPSAGSNGSITPATPQTVPYGGTRTFAFNPNAGYHVDAVKVDGVFVGKPASYTFTNVTADHTINVTFAPEPANQPTWYLAEGTNAWGFSTYITIENPNNERLTARLTYMNPNPKSGAGVVGTRTVALPPLSQTTVSSEPDIGLVDFSTKVECLQGKTIAVDRTMFWTGPGAASPEGHSSIGTTAPSKTWYLPEGSSNWGFETWTLMQNPNATDAHVKLTYMTEAGTPRELDRTIPARSRATYSMASDIGAADASIKVTSDVPVVAERSMYRNNRREGSCSIGASVPAKDLFLSEGTTAWGFTTYVLIQNPNNADASFTLTYMTPDGPVTQAPFTMEANSRKTIRVNDVPGVGNTDLSTQVSSDSPIIAERAMYWGEGTPAGEAMHASVGLDSPHMSFYLPDGQTSGGRETWTLVANPNPASVTVRITYLPQGGGTPVSFTDEIPPGSRRTYNMADKGIGGRASIMVQSLDGARPIIVERAMYWNSRGAGTDTIGGFSD